MTQEEGTLVSFHRKDKEYSQIRWKSRKKEGFRLGTMGVFRKNTRDMLFYLEMFEHEFSEIREPRKLEWIRECLGA